MNKQQLITRVSEQTGYKPGQVRVVVDSVIETLTNVLQQDERLLIYNFGVWIPLQQTQRPGRNPKTGEPKTIPSRRSVKFRPGNALIKALNNDKQKKGKINDNELGI